VNLNSIKTVYFIGIGGIGMSALARFFRIRNCKVSGYDKTQTHLTDELTTEGIDVHYTEDISKIPLKTDLIIYTPAIPSDNKELLFAFEKKFVVRKRSEILGEISRNMFTIAVAGTHGKTTITGLIAHIFQNSGIEVNAFIGGIVKNYNSNLLISEKSNLFIAEADEFDRSFLQLIPDISVVSAIDADHLDIYNNKKELQKAFDSFMLQTKKSGSLISKKEIITPEIDGVSKYQYSLDFPTDFYARDIRIRDSKFHFIANLLGNEIAVNIQIPGKHNIENAIAAAAVCYLKGLSMEQIKSGLESYQGVVRRFDYRVNTESLVYIDDYAHHPEELKACISAVRELYPGKNILGIFQPHLFSRTKHFADDFAKVMDTLDEAILLEIYPAREQPIQGVNSDMLLNRMKLKKKSVLSKKEVLEELKNKKIEVLLTMGAGDIDQLVQPIEELLNNWI
jgi:UDP-N-acetylmuramate--alanine ligase